MPAYEYTAIPAPLRSEKVKSAKTPADRYTATLTEAINQMAADGWEYLRAETLPSEERSGLTGRTTLFHNLLIFRRETAPSRAAAANTPVAEPAPAPAAPRAEPATAPKPAAPAEQPTASPVFSEAMRLSETASRDSAAPSAKPAG